MKAATTTKARITEEWLPRPSLVKNVNHGPTRYATIPWNIQRWLADTTIAGIPEERTLSLGASQTTLTFHMRFATYQSVVSISSLSLVI